jgi:glycosyltransferase involved in cell wall biosynthesis
VCLILEGTYPYVPGGVSTWTHDLIQMHEHLTFEIVALLSADAKPEMKFTLPPNVLGVTNVFLQKLPPGEKELAQEDMEDLFGALREPLMKLNAQPTLDDLRAVLRTLKPYRRKLGSRILLDSQEAWNMLLSMYEEDMPQSAFLDYFWSWRGLLGGLYSVLLCDLPDASVYHALCTGYAGVTLARAHLETGRPCFVTEHGIYTNERRIEIASADWLEGQAGVNFSVNEIGRERTLREFWIDTFCGYSKLCYDASDRIITLYEGNQAFQRMDGAAEHKLAVVPNGIDYERYLRIERDKQHPPTIALIGRVVPIKDVKTFIKATNILRHSVPDLEALIMGPMDEDPAYVAECRELVAHLKLEDTVTFTGRVKIEEYLPRVDVLVLTSISEAQPLAILEAGAAGIPTVATNVGACSEIIMGSHHEQPALGPGGGISAMANAQSTAEQILKLLSDPDYYQRCSDTIRLRVERYYHKKDQLAAYSAIYGECLETSTEAKAA